MSKKISINEIGMLISDELEKNGEISFVLLGRSMLPLIRDGKDTITLVKPKKAIRCGDVIFYRRENGQFILQRVMFVNNGNLVVRGDNQWDNEYNVRQNQIVGVLKNFERDGKIHNVNDRDYLTYVKFLPLIRLVRKTYYNLKSRVYKFVKFLVKK